MYKNLMTLVEKSGCTYTLDRPKDILKDLLKLASLKRENDFELLTDIFRIYPAGFNAKHL